MLSFSRLFSCVPDHPQWCADQLEAGLSLSHTGWNGNGSLGDLVWVLGHREEILFDSALATCKHTHTHTHTHTQYIKLNTQNGNSVKH